MTTLNTIIEEEKKEFEELYPPVHIGYDGNETDYFRREKFLEILATAMQRAYEAGRQSVLDELQEEQRKFIKGSA